jgi:hypothetical protein
MTTMPLRARLDDLPPVARLDHAAGRVAGRVEDHAAGARRQRGDDRLGADRETVGAFGRHLDHPAPANRICSTKLTQVGG